MPGFEIINKAENKEVNSIFKDGNGVLFRQGFENIRKNSYKVKTFEEKFRKKFKSKYSLAVTSGTSALRVALACKNIGHGDEVITQSFTFVATVEAIVESGAKPICTEIDDTLNMCPKDLEKKINKKTKAVIVVHMLGTGANLSEIIKICKKYNLILIEDTAWGIGAKYKNKFLGNVGDIGTYSFDFAKSLTTGEGGMLVFQNKKNFLAAKAWHDHGHENNPNYPRWEDTRSSSGFNFRMSELQGAVGIAQLKKFNNLFNVQKKNREKIITKIKFIKSIKIRKKPIKTTEAPESLIFSFKNKKLAKNFRINLLKRGYSTKILPEAISWHFAGKWKHIKELELKKNNYFNKSKNILNRSVSIPIFFKMKKNFPEIVLKSIEDTL
tara:strand:- start:2450 stop:3598 length:1149 start_codon:yes stop_codon:yes gene_type:complete